MHASIARIGPASRCLLSNYSLFWFGKGAPVCALNPRFLPSHTAASASRATRSAVPAVRRSSDAAAPRRASAVTPRTAATADRAATAPADAATGANNRRVMIIGKTERVVCVCLDL